MSQPNCTVLPDDDGIRPAGPQDACLYCRSKIGENHKPDCGMIKQRVKVRYTFDLELLFPASWDADMIEFHHNEGSWCANNAIKELQKASCNGQCLCGRMSAQFLEVVDAGPIVRSRKQAQEEDLLQGKQDEPSTKEQVEESR